MFKRKYRLPAGVKLTKPSAYKIPSLKLLVSENGLSFNRFGFVISKQVDKSAVVRNRTKRLARSCLEEMQENIKSGYDMLFILQKNAVAKERGLLYKEIEKLLLDAKILNKNQL